MGGKRVLISAELPVGSDASHEGLWARSVGPRTYQLENIPFGAYGLNLGDIVEVAASDQGLVITRVITRSDHETVRVLAWPDTNITEIDALLDQLAALGCGIERATERWVAIDIPPTVPGSRVEAVLQDGWQRRIWRYENANEGPPTM